MVRLTKRLSNRLGSICHGVRC